jgi:TetR/AcrR family transcriptional regulator, repressor for neighboring sulfatase
MQPVAAPVKRPSGREEILDAVLDAAERLFADAGPADVSLRAIAREAGVNYGLVHRHFGTKGALFDRLLQRYAERWADQLGGDPDYQQAVELLLGESAETGAYLRLLAWTLLSTDDAGTADAHRRHATLDRLPPLKEGGQPGDDPAIATAAALALVFGWRFFHPFIRAALHLEERDPSELHEAVRGQLREMIGP